MSIKPHIIVLVALILSSCDSISLKWNQPRGSESEWSSSTFSDTTSQQFCEDGYHYCLAVPSNLQKALGEENLPVFFTEVGTPRSEDFFIEINHPSLPCASSLIGSWQMNEIQVADTKTAWGKVDFFEKFGSRGQGWVDYDGPQPLCAGPAPFGYAFCSEKDGKTVVICIQQQKDNPAVAKEIFETFKWLK